jgi:hypothetical protein
MANNPHSTRGWRRIALPASLIVNLFLAAVIGGHLLKASPEIGRGPVPLSQTLANAEALLSPQDAAPFGDILRRDAPRYAGAAKQLAEARTALGHEITAEKFDPEAVRRALADWQAKSDNFVNQFGGTLIDALAQVSPEGRRRLVDARRRSQFISPTP